MGLQIGEGFRDYESGKEGLQIGAVLRFSNRGKKFTNRARDFKSGQRLQIGAREITNRGSDFKLGHRLQIGAEHMQIVSAKSRRVKGASHQPAFMGNCLTISHTCLPCLPSR